MSTFSDLSQLVRSFYRDVELAKQLESTNPEDNIAIKASIVGFSYNAPTRDWTKCHFDFVNSRLDREFHDEELSEYGQNNLNVRLFFAIALGYLLGLYQEDKIDDEEFKIAEQQISGLIMMHLAALTEKPVCL